MESGIFAVVNHIVRIGVIVVAKNVGHPAIPGAGIWLSTLTVLPLAVPGVGIQLARSHAVPGMGIGRAKITAKSPTLHYGPSLPKVQRVGVRPGYHDGIFVGSSFAF